MKLQNPVTFNLVIMVSFAHAFAINLYKYDIGIQLMHIYFISLMCVYAIFVVSHPI